jgi:hypothetical protein
MHRHQDPLADVPDSRYESDASLLRRELSALRGDLERLVRSLHGAGPLARLADLTRTFASLTIVTLAATAITISR